MPARMKSKRTKKAAEPRKTPQRPIDVGRKRSGEHVNPRRRVSLPEEAWELIDRCAEKQLSGWLEWLRGTIAIASAQQLKLDEAETVKLFDRMR